MDVLIFLFLFLRSLVICMKARSVAMSHHGCWDLLYFFPLVCVVKKGGLPPNEHDLSVWPVFIHGIYIYTDLLLKVSV